MNIEPSTEQAFSQIRPALVVEIDPSNGCVLVHEEDPVTGGTLWCRMATDGIESLARGDEVLVARAGHETGYVIGLLDRPARPPASAPAASAGMDLCGGFRAVVHDGPEAPVLTVLGPGDAPVFEYRADQGVLTIQARDTACELAGHDIRVRAAGTLSLAGRRIAMNADDEIIMRTGTGASPLQSSIRVSAAGIQMLGLEIGALARRALLRVRETHYVGRVIESHMDEIRYRLGRLRGEAGEIVGTAGKLYMNVKGLSQICASRLRAVVRDTFHLTSRSTRMRTEKDTFIDGEKIHLG